MDVKNYKLSPEDRELLYQMLGIKTLGQDMKDIKTNRPMDILQNFVNYNLKEELKKGLSDIQNHMEDYHFYRYMAYVIESKEKNKDIRYSIASWMCHSRHEDLPFNDIFVLDDEIYIYTYRPGLWIGRGGKTIDDCLYHINHKVDGTKYRDLKINLIESKNDAVSEVYSYMLTCHEYTDFSNESITAPNPKKNLIKI